MSSFLRWKAEEKPQGYGAAVKQRDLLASLSVLNPFLNKKERVASHVYGFKMMIEMAGMLTENLCVHLKEFLVRWL